MKDLLPESSYARKDSIIAIIIAINRLEIGCLLYCIAELNKGSS